MKHPVYIPRWVYFCECISVIITDDIFIGDPTVFGNFPPPPEANEAIINSVINNKNNGYGPSVGTMHAREAIAEYLTRPTAPVTANVRTIKDQFNLMIIIYQISKFNLGKKNMISTIKRFR